MSVTVIWDLEDEPDSNVQHILEHGLALEAGSRESKVSGTVVLRSRQKRGAVHLLKMDLSDATRFVT